MNGPELTFPAMALVEACPYRLPAGAVFKFRESWCLRVAYSEIQTDQFFLILQGERAGQLHRVGLGMARSLCIADPFSWFAVIDPQDPANSDALHSACLTIHESGPVIIGQDMDDDAGHEAFALSGAHCADFEGQAVRTRFDRWSAHLQTQERPFQSLGTIFKVNRRTTAV